jgi:hypothetical protein
VAGRGDERGVLLCEETAAPRRVVLRDRQRIVELSTLDFLRILESERRIQSAEAVFDLAVAASRTPFRVEKVDQLDEETKSSVRNLARAPRP